ncbi:MAG: MCE family protein [Planctomycetes bacterium]|nr:MCE family protein [Planctomycetota bacterium]
MSDYDTIQQRRNLVVGLFVIIGLFSFGWLIFKFGDLPRFVTQWKFFDVHVQFRSAAGAQKDTPVHFCGYQVGRVSAVTAPEILPELEDGQPGELRYHQTRVTLSIAQQYDNIPVDSTVTLMTRGLGSSFIEIKPPSPDPARPVTQFMVDGTSVQGATGMTSEFFPQESQEKLELLVDDIRVFLGNANNMAGDQQNQENFKTILTNIAAASSELTQTLVQTKATLSVMSDTLDEYRNLAAMGADTLSVVSETLNEYRSLAASGTDTLKHADVQFEAITQSFVETSQALSKVASEVRLLLGHVNAGEGTLGRLIQDARFYENLLATTEQLQVLVQQLKAVTGAISERGLGHVWRKGTQ